jgi:Mce-associated membrane protein
MAVDVDTSIEMSTAVDDGLEADQCIDQDEDNITPLHGGPPKHRRHLLLTGLVMVLALAGLTGWLGYRSYQVHQTEQRHELFLQTARQAALNLTTISHTEVDADVQRILDSATGTFYDDFQQRSKPFVEVVRQAQSTSLGNITAAGVETENADGAQVLVAVTVKTSTSAGADQQPRSWRMRLTVQRVDHGAKVANVEFVP